MNFLYGFRVSLPWNLNVLVDASTYLLSGESILSNEGEFNLGYQLNKEYRISAGYQWQSGEEGKAAVELTAYL